MKLPDIRLFVSTTPADIKINPAGKYDIKIKAGHNHDEADKEIPARIFVQNVPVGLVNIKGQSDHTIPDVSLDLSKPIKVRIERAGYKNEGDEIEFPVGAVKPPPQPKAEMWTIEIVEEPF